MADTDVVVFENDEEMQRYWLDWNRSDEMGTFDRVDAIKAFRDKKIDILWPDGGKWRGYRLHAKHEACRKGVQDMTGRLRALLLNGTIA